METIDQAKLKNTRKLIISLSVVIPIAVAILFKVKIGGIDLSFLPAIYAGINALTAVFLISALVAIKNKNMELHRALIRIALGLSVVFLLLYVAYHMTSDSTKYGNPDATARLTYFLLLITHIILSVAVIPMVLFSYLHAWEGNFEKHKKLTKITWPIWFYVAVSGVIVYLMISPYYGTN